MSPSIAVLIGCALATLPPALSAAPEPSAVPVQGGPPAAQGAQVLIDAKFFELTDAAWRTLSRKDDRFAPKFGDAVPDPGAPVGPPFTFTFREGKDAAAMMEMLRAERGVSAISSPRVITRSGQRATISIGEEMSYVVDPVTAKIETQFVGINLDVEPVVREDGGIDLLLAPKVVELIGHKRIVQDGTETTIKVQDGKPVEIKAGPGETVIPVFSTRMLSQRSSVRGGQTLVLGGLPRMNGTDGEEKPTQILLFATVTVEPKPADAAPAAGGKPSPGSKAPAPPSGGSTFNIISPSNIDGPVFSSRSTHSNSPTQPTTIPASK
jgi:hypothetical protein